MVMRNFFVYTMIEITIDGLKCLVLSGLSILETSKTIGINIPRFCYHETLSVAGNCRMCLVEIHKITKPVASCAVFVTNKIIFFTSSPLVKKARENVLESLLLNHPLDCPICDQGGECDLQEETKFFGTDYTRFFFYKRIVEDKNCGSVIKTVMTRCIHCTRCVRFSSEITGEMFFGTINRGYNTEISNYVTASFNSHFSGNVIDLCPVGALTSKLYAFKARPWELEIVESIDLTDSSGVQVYFHFKESELLRILPKINFELNGNWISDRIRFSFDTFKNYRLQTMFEHESFSTFIKINWKQFFFSFDCSNIKKKKIFIINDDIDLKSLMLLKRISFAQFFFFDLKSNKKQNFIKNYSINITSNTLSKIDISSNFFLIFTNLYTENATTNVKIKTNFTKKKLNIFNFGKTFFSTYLFEYNIITLTNFFIFIKGKLKLLSKILLKTTQSLFVFGEAIYKNFSRQNFLDTFIKKIVYNFFIINANLKSNTESLKQIFIKNINNKDLINDNSIVLINLEDTITVRSYLETKRTYWLNAYGSNAGVKSKYIIPLLNLNEEKNIFINFESKPKQTKKLFFNKKKIASLKIILACFIDNFIFSKEPIFYFFLSYLTYCLINTNNFKQLKNKFLKNLICFYEKFYGSFSFYPIKYLLENFFTPNNFCKNSFNLNNLSTSFIKLQKNFYF